jgi:hypothetical protein
MLREAGRVLENVTILFIGLECPARMSDTTAPDDDTGVDSSPGDESADDLDEPAADESGLLGKIGVEEEVLAELARAEAKLSDPSAPDDDPDGAGAQV